LDLHVYDTRLDIAGTLLDVTTNIATIPLPGIDIDIPPHHTIRPQHIITTTITAAATAAGTPWTPSPPRAPKHFVLARLYLPFPPHHAGQMQTILSI
jgi:hypothetical protein